MLLQGSVAAHRSQKGRARESGVSKHGSQVCCSGLDCIRHHAQLPGPHIGQHGFVHVDDQWSLLSNQPAKHEEQPSKEDDCSVFRR
jgi:hypothetical protein